MATDFFADIPTIRYEGPDSDNELAYRFYDKNRVVLGKTMEEHLRMAVAIPRAAAMLLGVFGGLALLPLLALQPTLRLLAKQLLTNPVIRKEIGYEKCNACNPDDPQSSELCPTWWWLPR